MPVKKASSTSHPHAGFAHKAFGPFIRHGWGHWIRFAALLTLGTYLGHLLSESARFTDIRFAIYQYQTRMLRRGPIYPQHTALVLLDDDDYWGEKFQSRDPIKRDQLAILIDRLNQAGVNTVAIDLDFYAPFADKPTYEYPDFIREDAILFASMKKMCDNGRHVVLVTDVQYAKDGYKEVGESIYVPRPLIFSHQLAQLPCVTIGYAQFSPDMRQVPGLARLENGSYLDSFALAIVKIDDPVAYNTVVDNPDRGFRFAQFLTPEDFSPKEGRQFVFNGEAIRTLSDAALRQSVANRIVIIGERWHSLAYGIGGYRDMHASPGGNEPGAMLHANYVEAIRNETGTYTPISDRAAEIVEWGLVLLLALLSALDVHSAWKWGGFFVTCLFCMLLTYVLLQNLGLFLDFFIPFLMIVVHTVLEELLAMRRELHQARHHLKGKHP